MDIEVVIVSSSEKNQSKPYWFGSGDNKLYVMSEIYLLLGSLIKNSNLTIKPETETIYDEFINDMNEMSISGFGSPELMALDEYLSKLGVDRDYPIKRHTTNRQEPVNAELKRTTDGK